MPQRFPSINRGFESSADAYAILSYSDVAQRLVNALSPWLCIPDAMKHVISPLAIVSPTARSSQAFLYIALGGLGVGKNHTGLIS